LLDIKRRIREPYRSRSFASGMVSGRLDLTRSWRLNPDGS
jgi:hypothetical protein